MPKAIYVPEPIPKDQMDPKGTEATIDDVRIVRDQWTTIGTLKLGIGLNVKIKDNLYSQLFSLDKEIITGSIGRILVAAKIDLEAKNLDLEVQKLKGKKVKIVQRAGKLYWYPI